MQACNQAGNVRAAAVHIAGGAGLNKALGITAVAGVEVGEAGDELALKRDKALTLNARFFKLLCVELAHARHRGRSRGARFPRANDFADVRKRKAHVLQLRDELNTHHRVGRVEAIATLAAIGRSEEPKLFVEMKSANGLARLLGQVTHAQ